MKRFLFLPFLFIYHLVFSNHIITKSNTNYEKTQIDSLTNLYERNSKIELRQVIFSKSQVSDSLKQDRAKKLGKWSFRLGISSFSLFLLNLSIGTAFPILLMWISLLSLFTGLAAFIIGIFALRRLKGKNRRIAWLGMLFGSVFLIYVLAIMVLYINGFI